MTVLLAGVALGAAGSAHCVAMCGPLLAVVAPRGRRAALHHAGRAAVYVLLGAGAGLAGAGMNAAGLGRWWAFSLAGILLLQAASQIATVRVPRGRGWTRVTKRLTAMIRGWAVHHPVAGAFGVGAMNGLLPCGLVYGATVASAAFGSLAAAVFFMTGFAIGTTPALLAGCLSVDWMRRRLPLLTRLTPLLLVLLAALLIARALQAPESVAHVH